MRQLIATLGLLAAVLLGLLALGGPGGDASQAIGSHDRDTVRWAQDLLYRADYYDGDFSEQLDAPTAAAIELFQTDYQLDPNAVLDPATIAALERLEELIRGSDGLLDDID